MRYLDLFEAFNMKGKDLTQFVRFGGLDLKNQKGFGNTTYHSPPATRGFYAMPLVAQEYFLIGSMDKFQPGTMPKYPKKQIVGEDENGIPVAGEISDEQWKEHHKRSKRALSAMRKTFTKKDGTIWHHLSEYTPNNEVINRHNSWIKTSVEAWRKAFVKMSLTLRYDDHTKTVNNARLFGNFSKDHCEVFFDEKV